MPHRHTCHIHIRMTTNNWAQRRKRMSTSMLNRSRNTASRRSQRERRRTHREDLGRSSRSSCRRGTRRRQRVLRRRCRLRARNLSGGRVSRERRDRAGVSGRCHFERSAYVRHGVVMVMQKAGRGAWCEEGKMERPLFLCPQPRKQASRSRSLGHHCLCFCWGHACCNLVVPSGLGGL